VYTLTSQAGRWEESSRCILPRGWRDRCIAVLRCLRCLSALSAEQITVVVSNTMKNHPRSKS
jgi:hypothetical protein